MFGTLVSYDVMIVLFGTLTFRKFIAKNIRDMRFYTKGPMVFTMNGFPKQGREKEKSY